MEYDIIYELPYSNSKELIMAISCMQTFDLPLAYLVMEKVEE